MNEGLLVVVILYFIRGIGIGILIGSFICLFLVDEVIKCWCLEGILFYFFF